MSTRDREKRLLSQDLMEKNWIGEVIENNDERTEFRCKIKVFGLFDDLDVDAIPWAFPGNHTIFASNNGGSGSGSVPKIGTLLKVKFENGDIYAPIYYAIQNVNPGLKEEIKDDYLGTHVLVYDEDADLKILYQPGTGIKIHLKDSHITINPDTDITIEHSTSDSIIELLGDTINILSTNEINITSENCNVDSPNIKLGENAFESVIKGDSFKKIYDLHTHASAGAPPVIPLPSGVLSKNTKTR